MSDSMVVWGIGSGRTLRVHWALREAGLRYQTRPVTPRSGETHTADYLRLNPRGKVPLLQHGPLCLAETGAIVNYVGERLAPASGLVPRAGGDARALYDQWCFFILMELDAHTLYVLRRHEDLADLYGEAPAATKAARAYFQRQASVADDELGDGRPFLLGDDFTGADIHLTTCLTWAELYGEALPANLAAYRARLTARPGYRDGFAVNFPPEVLQALIAARATRPQPGAPT